MSIEYVTMRVSETYTNRLKRADRTRTPTPRTTRETTPRADPRRARRESETPPQRATRHVIYTSTCMCGVCSVGRSAEGETRVERPHTLLFIYLYRSTPAPRGEVRSPPAQRRAQGPTPRARGARRRPPGPPAGGPAKGRAAETLERPGLHSPGSRQRRGSTT